MRFPMIRNEFLMLSATVQGLVSLATREHGVAMTTTPETYSHYEVHQSEDENQWKVTTITYHGRLVSDNAEEIRELVKRLISEGGHIVIDFADLKYLDSLGIGTLVGLKVSAINKGFCKLEFVNLSSRMRELMTITGLTQLFSL